MLKKKFSDYIALREAKEEKDDGPLGTKVSLGDDNSYEPLFVSDDPKSEHNGKNKNLAPVIRAFKQGANWGWTRDDKKGEDKPVKISGKKLYAIGGGVRDHLAGKTAKKMDLVTNASPDEIFKILTQNDFKFAGTEEEAKNTKGKKKFWISSQDNKKRPFGFTVQVNDQKFELSVFTKNAKGQADLDDLQLGTLADDAGGRDFTMNALAVLLGSDNGPNKELTDFFGGAHHLKDGKVVSIGDFDKKLAEDPLRAFRFARMNNKYGKPKDMNPKYKDSIKSIIEKLMDDDDETSVDPKRVMDEFMDGLGGDDDSRRYMNLYNSLGLSDFMFPGMKLNKQLPKELSEIGDKFMPLAFMLGDQDPKDVEGSMKKGGWNPDDSKKISFLIKSNGIGDDMDDNSLDDILGSFLKSGVSNKKLKDWLTKIGGKDSKVADSFLKYSKEPRVRPTSTNEEGEEEIGDDFLDLVDPFSMKIPTSEMNNAEGRRKGLEGKLFKRMLGA